jgi:hypothetical protein
MARHLDCDIRFGRLDFFDMLFHFVAEEPANIATIRVLLEPPPVDSDGTRRADGA